MIWAKTTIVPKTNETKFFGRSGQPGKRFPFDYVGNFQVNRNAHDSSQLLAMFYTLVHNFDEIISYF